MGHLRKSRRRMSCYFNASLSTLKSLEILTTCSMQEIRFACGGHNFLAAKQPVAHLLSTALGQHECRPVTAIFADRQLSVDSAWIEKEKRRMLEGDDVINEEFFAHVLVCYKPASGEQRLQNEGTAATVAIATPWLESVLQES